MTLEERTVGGLHDFIFETVVERYAKRGGRAADLGAGSGAIAIRLQAIPMDVVAVEMDPPAERAPLSFLRLDLNDPDFSRQMGEGSFDLVLSTEVIEHLENPVSFLKNISRLLSRDGFAILTTPNVDNFPARLKFLFSGKIRMIDERGDLTHISPIFLDLFTRQLLPRAGLKPLEHCFYPPRGFKATRKGLSFLLAVFARLFPGEANFGDSHIFVLGKNE